MILEVGISLPFREDGWVSDWDWEVKWFSDIIPFIDLFGSIVVCFLCDDK